MNGIYRKPSIHVAGITSILLKGFVGLPSLRNLRVLPGADRHR